MLTRLIRNSSLGAAIVGEASGARTAWRALPRPERLRFAGCAVWIVAGALAFIQPLTELVMYASDSRLNSHIPLVPFVAAYLLLLQRDTLPTPGRTSIGGGLTFAAISVALVGTALTQSAALSSTDRLSLMTLGYVTFVTAGGFLFLGSTWMARAAFPVAFLTFMVPLPDVFVDRLERALVLASAEAAAWLFRLTGTPLLRQGTIFQLPTIVLEVARECSGIHSTWVLFITSLVGSRMFLKSTWHRLLLVAFIVPLGIVRNGVRILVIGLLCVHVGPHMIDSFIHHQGGPIFFVLSLGPLFLVLSYLRRREQLP
jgi:exosortase C (VPDSG-CTERM-specific)